MVTLLFTISILFMLLGITLISASILLFREADLMETENRMSLRAKRSDTHINMAAYLPKTIKWKGYNS